ncbi:MAG: FAD-dependent oxidoreductase [Thermoleophilia bacterium]
MRHRAGARGARRGRRAAAPRGLRPARARRARARERVPALSEQVLGGVFWDEDAHVTPHVLVPALAAAAERRGARLVRRAVVTGFARDAGGRVSAVETDAGPIACERVVLAAGWESVALARRLGVRLPVEPGKGYHVHLDGNPPGLTIPLILQESVVGATPMGSELRFAGTMEFVGADRTLAPDRARRLIRGAARYLRGLDPEQPARLWTGFRPCTPDSLPLLGALRAAPNVVVATGHGMLGITLAGSTGADAASLATGRPASTAAAAFTPARFGL